MLILVLTNRCGYVCNGIDIPNLACANFGPDAVRGTHPTLANQQVELMVRNSWLLTFKVSHQTWSHRTI